MKGVNNMSYREWKDVEVGSVEMENYNEEIVEYICIDDIYIRRDAFEDWAESLNLHYRGL